MLGSGLDNAACDAPTTEKKQKKEHRNRNLLINISASLAHPPTEAYKFIAVIRSPAILGPSGSLSWLLEGSEDPWLSVPVFRRVWLYRCYLLRVVEDWSVCPPVNIIRTYSSDQADDRRLVPTKSDTVSVVEPGLPTVADTSTASTPNPR